MVFQWLSTILIFTDPYCDSKHTNEICLKACLKLCKIKMMIEIKIMMKVHINLRNLHSNNYFLLYTHEVYAKTKKKFQKHPSCHTCHYQNNVLGLPCLTFCNWHLWTEAEISSKQICSWTLASVNRSWDFIQLF